MSQIKVIVPSEIEMAAFLQEWNEVKNIIGHQHHMDNYLWQFLESIKIVSEENVHNKLIRNNLHVFVRIKPNFRYTISTHFPCMESHLDDDFEAEIVGCPRTNNDCRENGIFFNCPGQLKTPFSSAFLCFGWYSSDDNGVGGIGIEIIKNVTYLDKKPGTRLLRPEE